MDTLLQFVADIDAETNRIAALIEDLIAQINTGGVSDAQLTAALQPVVDSLKQVGTNPPQV